MPDRTPFPIAAARALRCNVRLSRKQLAFDVAVLAACCALFYLNDLALKPWLLALPLDGGAAFFRALMVGHFNDLLAGVAFLAYVNALLDAVKPEVRFRSLASDVVFIFFCGLFWECAAPLFVQGSVGDPWDLLAYVAGGVVYWAFEKLRTRFARPRP